MCALLQRLVTVVWPFFLNFHVACFQDRRRRPSTGSASERYASLSGKLSSTSLRKDLSLPRIAAHSTDSLLESLRQDNRILAGGGAATLGRSTSALGFANRQSNLPHAFSMDYIKLPHLSGKPCHHCDADFLLSRFICCLFHIERLTFVLTSWRMHCGYVLVAYPITAG